MIIDTHTHTPLGYQYTWIHIDIYARATHIGRRIEGAANTIPNTLQFTACGYIANIEIRQLAIQLYIVRGLFVFVLFGALDSATTAHTPYIIKHRINKLYSCRRPFGATVRARPKCLCVAHISRWFVCHKYTHPRVVSQQPRVAEATRPAKANGDIANHDHRRRLQSRWVAAAAAGVAQTPSPIVSRIFAQPSTASKSIPDDAYN